MRISSLLIRFGTTFAIVFVVNAVVVYVWNLIRHGEGAFDWGLTLALAVMLGIVLTLTEARKSRGSS